MDLCLAGAGSRRVISVPKPPDGRRTVTWPHLWVIRPRHTECACYFHLAERDGYFGKGRPVAYLLNLAYLLLIVLAAPCLVFRAVVRGKYRQGWSAKLLGLVPRREG